jgi:acyl-CoA synthetase (NDP forming)
MLPASRSADQNRPVRDLGRMFRSRSAVLVGASQKSAWSHYIFNAIRDSGFSGPMYAVNKRGDEAHGLPGFVSCIGLPEQVDVAYIYVPTDAVIGGNGRCSRRGNSRMHCAEFGFFGGGTRRRRD